MNQFKSWMIRCLALAHFTWGGLIILLAAWFAVSSLLILPHMPSGTFWTKLPASLTMASIQSFPLGVLGTWIIVLGYRTWTGHAGLRKALVITHALLLVPGSLSAAVGFVALRAGARSAAKGGGLLSPIGVFPLAIGAGMIVLALASILLALAVVPKRET